MNHIFFKTEKEFGNFILDIRSQILKFHGNLILSGLFFHPDKPADNELGSGIHWECDLANNFHSSGQQRVGLNDPQQASEGEIGSPAIGIFLSVEKITQRQVDIITHKTASQDIGSRPFQHQPVWLEIDLNHLRKVDQVPWFIIEFTNNGYGRLRS